MQRSGLFRPQAIVVIFVALVVLSRGEVRWMSPAESNELVASISTPIQALPTPTTIETTIPTEPPVSPASTPLPTTPPIPTPTIVPTRTPTSAPTPTPTSPVRPVAPPTGVEDESLIIVQAESGRMEMAITFDAGDGRGYTIEILDVLDEYGVTASFGVTGDWAETNPDLLLEVIDRGHHVMNHTYSHRSFTGVSPSTDPLTPEERRMEVIETEQVIREIGDYETAPYFRFPYGDYERSDLTMLKELGYDYTMWWGCDSLAWMGSTPEDIVQRCGVEEAAPGTIVLLHVDPEADFLALPGLIERLQGDGYELVTLEQLIQP